MRDWLGHGLPHARFRAAPLHGGPQAGAASHRRAARRLVGGLFSSDGETAGGLFTDALAAAVSAGAALIRHAVALCETEWRDFLQRHGRARRLFRRYATLLRKRIRAGGPRRAALLAACWSLRERAHLSAVGGAWWPHHCALWALAHNSTYDGDARLDWLVVGRGLWAKWHAWRRLGIESAAVAAAGDTTAAAVTGADLPPRIITLRCIASRAAAATRRAFDVPRRTTSGTKRADLQVARAARAMQRFLDGDTIHGDAPRDAQHEVHVEVGGRSRRPRGARKRARLAENKRVERGAQADHLNGWSTSAVLDVRPRAGSRGGALEALIDWKGEWEPWWLPVNRSWIPDEATRREAREMHKARRPAPQRQAAPAAPTARARERNVRASVLHTRMAQDVDLAEEAELRRLEAGRSDERSNDWSEDEGDGEASRAGRAEDGASGQGQVRAAHVDLRSDDSGSDADEGGQAARGAHAAHRRPSAASAGDGDGDDSDDSGNSDDADDSDVECEGDAAGGGEGAHSPAAAREQAASCYSRACALRDAGGDERQWQRLMRHAALTRRRAERHMHEPLRYTTARHAPCERCGLFATHALCPTCTRGTLGGSRGDEIPQATVLLALCSAPTLEALAHVAPELDVTGDGSCWAYGILALGGLAHAWGAADRGCAPTRAQRCADVALRTAAQRLRLDWRSWRLGRPPTRVTDDVSVPAHTVATCNLSRWQTYYTAASSPSRKEAVATLQACSTSTVPALAVRAGGGAEGAARRR